MIWSTDLVGLGYRRFADILADACARLGADVGRYSSSQWTCTTYSLPVSRRTRVKTPPKGPIMFSPFRHLSRQDTDQINDFNIGGPSRLAGTVALHCEASYTAIHHVLTDPVYAGAYVYGRTRHEIVLDACGYRKSYPGWRRCRDGLSSLRDA